MVRRPITYIIAFLLGIGMIKQMSEYNLIGKYKLNPPTDIRKFIELNQDKWDEEIENKFSIVLPDTKIGFTSIDGSTSMLYFHDKDSIAVDTTASYNLLSYSEVGPLTRAFLHKETPKGHYIHERTHSIYNSIFKNLGSDIDSSFIKEEMWGIRQYMLIEGIAEYGRIMKGEYNFFPLEMCKPKSIDDLYANGGRKIYSYSPHVVRKILDRLGMEKGIEEILTNPVITENEILNPEIYADRILN